MTLTVRLPLWLAAAGGDRGLRGNAVVRRFDVAQHAQRLDDVDACARPSATQSGCVESAGRLAPSSDGLRDAEPVAPVADNSTEIARCPSASSPRLNDA